MSEQRCGTCSEAEWQLSEKGNRLRSVPGTCLIQFDSPILPICYEVTIRKTKIWPDMGKDCPTWHAK
jgi:hypothetical protein